jgi:teichuronic acid biosynthesis glycosyltransferase TuaC
MGPEMRIALVTTSWPEDEGDPSGHFVRAEARELERAGHEVHVVKPETGGAFGWPGVAARVRERPWRAVEAARWMAATRHEMREGSQGEKEKRRRVGGLASLLLLSSSPCETLSRFDRVVAHWAVPCAWPIGVAGAAPVHVVSHGGDVRLLAALPALVRARIVRAIAGRAVEWRFVSESLLGELTRVLGREDAARVERIAVVRAAAVEMPDVRDAVAAKRRELAGARVAVSVGRLVASKRVDRAIAHVARAAEVDALVVVGDGPERAALEREARAQGVDALFVGRVARTEALAWIGAASVLLDASEAEGASTVAREARAMGTRVERIRT